MFDVTLTDIIFQYESQFVDSDNITQCGQRTNVQITDKLYNNTLGKFV